MLKCEYNTLGPNLSLINRSMEKCKSKNKGFLLNITNFGFV